jgi:sugar phosphate isomerase/epimerase
MKISCLPVSYFPSIISGDMSIEEWVKQGADLGFDGIDLSCLLLKELAPSYLEQLRCSIEAAGMQVAMLCTYPDFTHPDRCERSRQVELERAYVGAAGHLRCDLLRITAGQAYPGLNEADGIRWTLEGLRACEETALRVGVRLVLENHSKPGCWCYADFALETHIFLALAGGIENTTVGINFDTANPLVYGDDPLPILASVVDQVVSIHASDTATRGELNPVVLGTGLVPFRDIFSYLKKNAFDGWICIEEASNTGRSGVEQALSFVRRAWDEA